MYLLIDVVQTLQVKQSGEPQHILHWYIRLNSFRFISWIRYCAKCFVLIVLLESLCHVKKYLFFFFTIERHMMISNVAFWARIHIRYRLLTISAYKSHHKQQIHINLFALMRYSVQINNSKAYRMKRMERIKQRKRQQTIKSDIVSWVKYKLYGYRGLTKSQTVTCVRWWLVNNMISSNGCTMILSLTNEKKILNSRIIYWWSRFAKWNYTICSKNFHTSSN